MLLLSFLRCHVLDMGQAAPHLRVEPTIRRGSPSTS